MNYRMDRPTVMLVDDDLLIHQFVHKALDPTCRVIDYTSGGDALENVCAFLPDMMLLDVVMPGIDGFETLRRIREIPELNYLPVIFLTAQSDVQFELQALNLGAVDYIFKPFAGALLAKRVEVHLSHRFRQQMLMDYNQNLQQMVEEKVRIIQELKSAIVYTLADLVELRDNSTGGHVLRTKQYYRLLLDYLVKHHIYEEELRRADLDQLAEASQMHDIGKVAIPDSILLKPGPLSFAEFEQMKTHVWIGYQALVRAMEITEDKEFLEYAAEVAVSHHEKWDGSGYPKGLSKTQIPLSGRIMAVVDVYDALISERHYKHSIPHEDAVRILVAGSGSHFDPALVSAFLSLEKQFRALSQG